MRFHATKNEKWFGYPKSILDKTPPDAPQSRRA
jgi:hypothetical protein